MSDGFLLSRLLLRFDGNTDDLLHDISATAFTPDGSLWIASDELVGIDRLSPVQPLIFGHHQRFALNDFVELFNPDDEIDIEGMDYANHYLWLTGSHGTKRKKPKGKEKTKDIKRLAQVTVDLNRFLIARIPIINGKPIKSCSLSDNSEEKLTAAYLQKCGDRNILIEALEEDEHLAPFIVSSIPSKDNGFDIEGLAVHDDTIFLGLRGPVLRGWAIILEIKVEEIEPGVLGLKSLGEEGKLYQKHFVDLGGLGIRELCLKGEDLIILAGPTMELEGAMQVFRFKNALNRSGDTICSQDSEDLAVLFDLPFRLGTDHAEGLALYSCLGQENALVVVYDAPDSSRILSNQEVFADVFLLK